MLVILNLEKKIPGRRRNMFDRERIAVFVEEYRTQLVVVLCVLLLIVIEFSLVAVHSESSRKQL